MYLFALAFFVYCLMMCGLGYLWRAVLITAVAGVWLTVHAWPAALLSLAFSIFLIFKYDIPPFGRWVR